MLALPRAPFLYPILDLERLGGRDVGHAVEALAAAGVRVVQVRAKRAGERALLASAARVLEAARPRGVRVVVNDRADVVRILEADGVHVGQEDLPPSAARRVVGAARWVGVSTHSLEQLASALREPIDYVAIGPIFPTRTKENPDPVVGLDLVRRARQMTPLPLVAIGGIRRGNARSVIEAGADAVAVIADLLDAPDLAQAAREMVAALG